jgi:hypothetical protein
MYGDGIRELVEFKTDGIYFSRLAIASGAQLAQPRLLQIPVRLRVEGSELSAGSIKLGR